MRNGGLRYIAIVPNMHGGRDDFKLEVRNSAFYLKRVLYYSANTEGDIGNFAVIMRNSAEFYIP